MRGAVRKWHMWDSCLADPPMDPPPAPQPGWDGCAGLRALYGEAFSSGVLGAPCRPHLMTSDFLHREGWLVPRRSPPVMSLPLPGDLCVRPDGRCRPPRLDRRGHFTTVVLAGQGGSHLDITPADRCVGV